MTTRTRFAAIGSLVIVVLVAGVLISAPWDDDDPGACAPTSEAELDETVASGVAWLARALQADGSFWYEYDKAADEFSDDYNYVRHGGALMALMHVAAGGGHTGDTALEVGDGGLEFVFDQLIRTDDRAAFNEPGRPSFLGSAALVAVALVHRRIATGDDTHDELMRDIGRFMISLQRDDGGMWSEATGIALEPAVGQTSTFYTGESFYALGLLANLFPDDGWDDAAEAVGFYIATARDEEEEIDNPPLADQWAAYGFGEMRDWGALESEELVYVRSLIERYHSRINTEIGREANRVGDGTGPPDESVSQARGAGFGTSVEALGSLWRLSLVQDGLTDLQPQLRDDLVCGAAILAARQFDEARAAEWPRPEIVEGAWYDINDDGADITRVDDQQHAISGVLRAIEALDG